MYFIINQQELDKLLNMDADIVKFYLLIKRHMDFNTWVSGKDFRFSLRYFRKRMGDFNSKNQPLTSRKIRFYIDVLVKEDLIYYAKKYIFVFKMNKTQGTNEEQTRNKQGMKNPAGMGSEVYFYEQVRNEEGITEERHICNNKIKKNKTLTSNPSELTAKNLVIDDDGEVTKKRKKKSIEIESVEDFQIIADWYHLYFPHNPVVRPIKTYSHEKLKKEINRCFKKLYVRVKNTAKLAGRDGITHEIIYRDTVKDFEDIIYKASQTDFWHARKGRAWSATLIWILERKFDELIGEA